MGRLGGQPPPHAQVVLFGGLAAHLSVEVYLEWQERQVVTVLADTELPVTELDFPAVTICSDGLNMNAVERALQKDLELWWEKEEAKGARKKRSTPEGSIDHFMMDKFNLEPGKSIFDVLRALSTPEDVSAVVVSNAIREVSRTSLYLTLPPGMMWRSAATRSFRNRLGKRGKKMSGYTETNWLIF